MPNHHFLLCLRVWNVTTIFCCNDAQVRLSSISGMFVCSSLLPHVNCATSLYLPCPCCSYTVHWWKDMFLISHQFSGTVSLRRLSKNHQAANSIPQRCMYFYRRYLLWNISLRWLAIFGNHSLECLWCFAASVHLLFHACSPSQGTAFWIYVHTALNYKQICKKYQLTL